MLSANGTLGGSSFAVYGYQTNSNDCYYAFNNTGSADYYHQIYAGSYITMYNPQPLKVSSFDIYFYTGRVIYGFTIVASNDQGTWDTMGTYTGSWSNLWVNFQIPVANRGFYKYYKIIWNSSSDNYFTVYEIKINATYLVV